MGVFTSACVNVQTCIKARIFSRWCLSLFLSGVCVCVMSDKGVWVSCYITLLYSLGIKSLTEPGVRLVANKPCVSSCPCPLLCRSSRLV